VGGGLALSAAPDNGPVLPDLIDRKGLEALGLGRRAVDAIVRACPVVAIPGVRRVYLRRADVAAFLEECTFHDDRVRP
jgi:hypothetical protein